MSSLATQYKEEWDKTTNKCKNHTFVFDINLLNHFYCALQISPINNFSSYNKLTKKGFNFKRSNMVFVIRPSIQNLNYIHKQIIINKMNNIDSTYSIIFMSYIDEICNHHLNDLEIKADVKILDIGFFPIIETNNFYCYSMSNINIIRELYLEHNNSCIKYIAKSLIKLFGSFSNIKTMGSHSKLLSETIQELILLNSKTHKKKPNLVILERSLDFKHMMLTDYNYEGFLDIDTLEKFRQSDDSLFKEIANIDYSLLLTTLKNKSINLKNLYNSTNNIQTVQDLRKAVDNTKIIVKEQQLLDRHINILHNMQNIVSKHQVDFELDIANNDDWNHNSAVEYVLDIISECTDKTTSLKLLCLLSLSKKKCFNQEVYDILKNTFLQTCGYENAYILHNLESMGLLSRNYSNNKDINLVNLINDKIITCADNPTVICIIGGISKAELDLIQKMNKPFIICTTNINRSNDVINICC